MHLQNKLFPTQEKNLFYIIVFALLAVLYAPVIFHWVDGWLEKNINIEHEYFTHALIGFPLAVYIVWQQRKKWGELKNQSHPLGGFLLGLASVFYLTSSSELVNLSFPLILIGLCLWLKGIPGLKLQWFPLTLILLGTPNSFPYLITPWTLPLQKFIAGTAGFILLQLGFNVQVDGIYLAVDNRLVEVAPYCAGLKMLFASIYVCLILLYWTGNLGDKRKTTFLLTGAVFISVTANILRNTLLSYFHGSKQDQLFAWLHDSWGGDLYSALMLGAIVLLMNFLDRTEYIEEEIEPELAESDE